MNIDRVRVLRQQIGDVVQNNRLCQKIPLESSQSALLEKSSEFYHTAFHIAREKRQV